MKILFVSISWPAPGVRNLYTDLMDEFMVRGDEVFVLATWQASGPAQARANPSAPVQGNGGVPVRRSTMPTREKGIRVLRVSASPIRKVSPIRKGLSLLRLGARMASALRREWSREAFDLLIAPTPPVTLSGLFRKIKRWYGVPFYLLLKDIWPQGPVDLGMLHKYSLPWWYLRYHELSTYKTADHIGCMSPWGVSYFIGHNPQIAASKVEECPNSIRPSRENGLSAPLPAQHGDAAGMAVQGDTGRMAVQGDAGRMAVRNQYGIPGEACLFIFSGNLCVGHGLDFLTSAITELASFREAFFLIGGNGTEFESVKKELNRAGSRNALLYNWLPAEDFIRLLDASDVGLILLHKYSEPQFPSRLLSYLDFGKAVLCAVNEYTDIGEIVESSGCGISVPHGDSERFVNAIRYLSQNGTIRSEMGRKGHQLLLDRYTVSRSYDIIRRHYGDQGCRSAHT